ncbi:pyridoxal-phosphate dependent enzyme [Neiella marina]|uniref:Pyridoxal-phosphate dependent enzyme n=1 Tax=Neiella holothuriorum TaxID=2870530 RepID=A0ABS7EAR9_9GAMM|nr:pyridoxal-phosphate dependent enzyme [Neiella holothuriorum]MBW8189432.1 pyridoxal-phosphate dependent enzyme [Neiella holothuriorum]
MFYSLFETVKPSPIMALDISFWCGFSAQISVMRDDVNHAVVSGNKLRKLKYPLQQAIAAGAKGITSFGGAYSNHAHALAYACQQLGLPCQLVIRGEEASAAQSATLADCQRWGATIHPVTRADYRLRHQPEQQLTWALPGHHILPEGGSAVSALTGVAELLDERTRQFRYIAAAVGSGGTAAGLQHGLAAGQKLLLVPAVRDASLPHRIASLLEQVEVQSEIGHNQSLQPAICWLTGYEWGGFARLPAQLQQFIAAFYDRTGVLLDPVYTAKLAYAVIQEVAAKRLPADGSVLMYHSGGLQGWRGMQQRLIPEMQDCLATLR